MIVGRLCITYPRGLKRNKADDVGLDYQPTTTKDGGVVRGLGTHFESEEDMARVKECEKFEYQIRSTVKENFLPSPIPGMFILPDPDAGERVINSVLRAIGWEIQSLEMSVRMVTYDLGIIEALPSAEVDDWRTRIKRQLELAPLGRAKSAKATGLDILDNLADCPILAQDTRDKIKSLIAEARIDQIDRLEFKRAIAELSVDVDVGPVAEPRRVEVSPPTTPLDEIPDPVVQRSRYAIPEDFS